MDQDKQIEASPVVFGLHVVPDGACGQATLDDLKPGAHETGFTWVNLDREIPAGRTWITLESGIDPICAEALYADDTRPRTLRRGSGMLINLRGVNLNPGMDPDDMVSLRMWIDESRLITIRKMKLLAIQDVHDQIEKNGEPNRAGAILTELADALIDRLAIVLEDIEGDLVQLEELLEPPRGGDERRALATLRRSAIRIRRYLAPQRDALNRLSTETVPWLHEMDKLRLREIADRVTRYVEDLDSIRERAAVVREDWATRQADRLNQTMYLLSVVTVIFLPLGLLTGLLGINVGGIPLADSSYGFVFVTIGLSVFAAVMITVFRLAKWF